MRRVVLLAAASVAVLGVASATAGTSANGARRSSITPVVFTDETGDSGSAADIRSVVVTNDTTGQYTIDIAFGAPLTEAEGVVIFLDTDRNAASGSSDAGGADYVLAEDQASATFEFEKWDGSAFGAAPSDSTVSVRLASGGTHLIGSFNRSEIDNSGGFDFWVASVDADGSAGHLDVAPSGSGTWTYQLQQPLRLALVAARAGAARAGGTWTITLAARRSDTGAALGGEGSIACRASVGGRPLPVVAKGFVSAGGGSGSSAFCRFRVAKGLRHRQLRGTITVSFKGSSVTRAFTTRVR